MTEYAIVADLGGTNGRFALVKKGFAELCHVKKYTAKEFDTFRLMLNHYRKEVKHASEAKSVAIAVACPADTDTIKFTNNHWSFSKSEIKQEYDLDEFVVMNDFEAVARSLVLVDHDSVVKVGSGQIVENMPKGVIGPGTGLGMASLVFTPEGRAIPVAGEGGHMSYSPQTERQEVVWNYLKNRFEYISVERLVSGQGIENIYEALTNEKFGEAKRIEAKDVTHLAFSEKDPVAVEAMDMFFEILGTVAGDFAMSIGAKGGLYLAGGILPRFPNELLASSMREQFNFKGRFVSYMREIPVYLIDLKEPGLKGAACYWL